VTELKHESTVLTRENDTNVVDSIEQKRRPIVSTLTFSAQLGDWEQCMREAGSFELNDDGAYTVEAAM
jgi:hypothetical protein